MDRTLTFLFAVALGATLGGLTALELAPLLGAANFLAATLGVLVGGLTGYIAVDYRQFCEGVTEAGTLVYSKPIEAIKLRWNTSYEARLSAFYHAMIMVMVINYIFALVATACILWDKVPDILVLVVTASSLIITSGLCFVTTFGELHRASTEEHSLEYHLKESKTFLYWCSPVGVTHAVFLKLLPWLLVGACKSLWWLVCSLRIFLKTLFVTVHSERRLLACFHAILGTLIGLYLGWWLAGTVAGLAFALVSYELVSKRWLKLQIA